MHNEYYIAVSSVQCPCFGYVILYNDNVYYIPEYDNNELVIGFTEIEFEHLTLIKYQKEYDLQVGYERQYAYYINKEKHKHLNQDVILFGNKELLSSQLMSEIENIVDAPFSQLDIAEFLDLSGKELLYYKQQCYNYIFSIDEGQAKRWRSFHFSEEEKDMLIEEQGEEIIRLKTQIKSKIPQWYERYFRPAASLSFLKAANYSVESTVRNIITQRGTISRPESTDNGALSGIPQDSLSPFNPVRDSTTTLQESDLKYVPTLLKTVSCL